MVGILYRMIFWELVKVFTLSLVTMTSILVLAGIVADASRQGLGILQILAVIPLLIPSMLPYAIPTTALFASCIVYGRLAADNEILAIKAAGINVLTIVGPIVVLGLVLSGVTFSLHHTFIPRTFRLMRAMAVNDVNEFLYALLRTEGQIKQPGLEYFMWVKRVQGRRLINPVFKKLNKDKSGYEFIANAKEAELHYDPSRNVLIVQMWHVVVYSEGSTAKASFPERMYTIDLPPMDAALKRRPREMTWDELLEHRARVVAEDESLAAQQALAGAHELVVNPHAPVQDYLNSVLDQRRGKQLEILSVDSELQMRPALSLGCLFFVLIGCPIGIWFSRSDYLSSFITCFLPIVTLYYPLLLCGTNLAKDGKVPAFISVWIANAVLGIGALALYRRLVRN